jgi:hydrophobe/amphiphile efflux-3 (HAE3) family protein
MERQWRAFAAFVVDHLAVVLGVVVAISVVLALTGIPRLEFATGQDSYLNDDEQTAIDNVEYQDLFGGQAMLTLFTMEEGKTVIDLFTPDNVDKIEEMTGALRNTENVAAVVSPLTALEWTANLVEGGTTSAAAGILLNAIEREEDPEAAAARSADTLRTAERLEAVGGPTIASREGYRERINTDPEYVEFLLVDNQGNIRKALRPFFQFAPGVEPTLENARYAGMVTRLGGNLSIEEEGVAADAVLKETSSREYENATTLTTGAPVLLKNINDYLQGGMLTLGGIAVLIMAGILLVAFGVRWRLLPLAVVLVGVLWAFSLFGLVGLRLSLVTISGLPILIGLGIDFAIQVHNRVHEEIHLNRSAHPFQETMVHIAPALLIATIAAVLAFLAMQLSRVPMIRDFGLLLAVGIAIIWLVGITVPLSVLAARERRSPSEPNAKDPSLIERLVVKLGGLPQPTVVPMIVLGVATFAFGILAEGAFKIQTDPAKWVDQDTEVITDLDTLEEQTGSSSELAVYLTTDDVFSDESADFVSDLAIGSLEQRPDNLLTASALATTVKYLMEVPGASDLNPTGADLEAAFNIAPPDIQRSLINEGAGAANLVFRTSTESLDELKEVVEDVSANAETLAPEGTQATPSGLAVIGVGLLDNLKANRALLTYVALGVVALWLALRFRSVTKSLLSLVPVLLAVGISSLVVAVLGLELSPLTTVSGPLIIATCTEFSALIISRYMEERKQGLSAREATDVASARTGLAFFTSALTTIGGFAVLVFSALPLLRDFGLIVTLNIAVALLSALVVLPPLLVWADEKGWMGYATAEPEPEPEPDPEPEPAGAPA